MLSGALLFRTLLSLDSTSFHQDGKTFLLEMVVGGQNLRNPFGFHDIHGNAILQAVAFIQPRFVARKAIEEGLPGLRNYPYSAGVHHVLHRIRCPLTQCTASPGKRRKKLRQDLICGHQRYISQPLTGFRC